MTDTRVHAQNASGRRRAAAAGGVVVVVVVAIILAIPRRWRSQHL
jgi:hypothetical protein